MSRPPQDHGEDNDHLKAAEHLIRGADIILCSGGNTLFGADRLRKLGLDKVIKQVISEEHVGKVVAGGSAGAVTWFAGGYSDSADPGSWMSRRARYCNRRNEKAMLESIEQVSGRAPMLQDLQLVDDKIHLQTATKDNVVSDKVLAVSPNEKQKSPDNDQDHDHPWDYICIPALNFLNALCIPHADRKHPNTGVVRAEQFDEEAVRFCRERDGVSVETDSSTMVRAICIDHWAVLIVEGERYRVWAVPEKEGSVVCESEEENGHGEKVKVFGAGGVPGVWVKDVVAAGEVHDAGVVHQHRVQTRLVEEGEVAELLCSVEDGGGSRWFPEDGRVHACRLGNPDPN